MDNFARYKYVFIVKLDIVHRNDVKLVNWFQVNLNVLGGMHFTQVLQAA